MPEKVWKPDIVLFNKYDINHIHTRSFRWLNLAEIAAFSTCESSFILSSFILSPFETEYL